MNELNETALQFIIRRMLRSKFLFEGRWEMKQFCSSRPVERRFFDDNER